MYQHPGMISNSGSKEADYYREIDLDERRERSIERMQDRVRQDVKDREPQTCNAYAVHCAAAVDPDLAYALCLARIVGDDQLMQQAQADIDKHLAAELDEFVAKEAVARRRRLLAQAEAIAQEADCA